MTTATTTLPDATALERLQIIQNSESVALVGVSLEADERRRRHTARRRGDNPLSCI